ncbi:MAG TPA: DNA mismatch repair protein MutS [Candidatus Mucispirillum faecigallinarum]|uniref:DNA mismatch repair protein MutS n=1 Tax=Candidatus Mucispirillum faecigallinarum TaxID=2838699 RepID=A0A9D2GWD3_9BACT|nr:DNA mismatch repair protein MutS [Candidatus Mucispirillum faecigallinarum]
MERPKNLTPAMAQFYDIKEQYPDSILFFRMGDFYEMFGDDALTASKILGIALTCRNKSSENQIPLCGIPYHSYMPYLVKLLKAGKKVAICEQLEDPKLVKGVVKRGVTRVVTPATALEDEAVVTFDNNFLISLYAELDKVYMAAVDVTTGETYLKTINIETLEESTLGLDAKEVISNIDIDLNNIPVTLRNPGRHYNTALNRVLSHYNVTSEKALFIEDKGYIWAIAMILDYLDDLILTTKLMLPVTLNDTDNLILDSVASSTLELTNSSAGKDNTLFYILNQTSTPMGARFLKNTILRPLRNISHINTRLDIVEYFVNNSSFLSTVNGLLSNIFDIERITSRLISGRATPKDLIWLKLSIKNIPELDAMLQSVPDVFTKYKLDAQEELYFLIEKAINDEPPAAIKEGGIIKSGYNNHVDELRDIKQNGKSLILEIEERERKKTGISQLKIGYNKVFGYYFEVSRLNASKMPDYFERKQTLANSERFITEELRELENKILNAEEKLADIEYALFHDIRKYASNQADKLRQLSKLIAEIDTIAAFANVSIKNNYSRPKMVENGVINIKEGRHPVVENKIKSSFVPNDFYLDNDDDRLLIITGPNMSGKSTYLRSSALIAVMAHCGCFVPADMAEIPLLDRIFTRVGASDNLSRGESTFMVEMVETANILKNATKNSLIILDEIGRGTSTFDGISIAWAVAEHILNNIGAKTLFATHYFELTEIGEKGKGAQNYTVSVEEWNNEVIFLRKVIKGTADKSYGIYVGKMAGLPESVIKRANEVLSDLENHEDISISQSKEVKTVKQKFVQPILVFDDSHPVIEELKKMDIDNITPIQAMQILSDLKKKSVL